MIGDDEAKTGLSWIREGKVEEEEDEEEEELRDAQTNGLNVVLLIEVLAGDKEERLKPFIEEVDIGVQWRIKWQCYIVMYDVSSMTNWGIPILMWPNVDNENES